jgi:hypothetical protein
MCNYKVSTGKKMGRVRRKKESENNVLIKIKIIKYKMTMSTLLSLLITTTYYYITITTLHYITTTTTTTNNNNNSTVALVYRLSNNHLLAKLVPTFTDTKNHVVSAGILYGCILGF